VIPLLEQMRAALDAHDLDTFVGFVREDYIGERPRHPGAPVSSRDDVRNNWAEVISDVPDLRVEVPTAVADGNTIWSEWRAYHSGRGDCGVHSWRGAVRRTGHDDHRHYGHDRR
jgi:SnoaL-like domain